MKADRRLQSANGARIWQEVSGEDKVERGKRGKRAIQVCMIQRFLLALKAIQLEPWKSKEGGKKKNTLLVVLVT